MLQRGDPVPHFDVRTIDGQAINYKSIWQHTQLVLVLVPAEAGTAAERYVSELSGCKQEFDAEQTTCVVTHDPVSGIPSPAAVVADRWGEIAYLTAVRDVSELPSAGELLDWASYVRSRCPECEGEAQ